MLLLLALWVLLSIVAGMWAHSRGRGAVTWLLIALLVSPVIATVLLLSTRNLMAEGVAQSRPSWKSRFFRIAANILMTAAVIAILVSLLNRGGMKPIRLGQTHPVEIQSADRG